MEEKKEKKTIKCSYALLVIILFATVAILTDYIIIDRKTSKCNCPKCEATKNEVISDNTDNTQVNENKSYTYEDVVGYYLYSLESETGKWFNNIHYSIFLFDDATFYMSYQNKDISGLGGIMGNYILDGNELKLNYLFKHGSNGAVMFGLDGSSNLIIENNKITGKLNFFDDKSVDVNLNKTEYLGDNIEQSKIGFFADRFEMCNSTNNYCGLEM